MFKAQFAQAVAQKVNGEVQLVEKANGVIRTGIIINSDSRVKPTIYIDEMYDNGLSVDDASARVLALDASNQRKDLDVTWIEDFEEVKPRLRARLYNQATKAEVKRPAGHGFDDLIVVPYIADVITDGDTRGSVKVTSALLDRWNVSADEVINIAESNTADHAVIQSMADVLREMCPGMFDEEQDGPKMMIVTTDDKCFGAYSIIAKLDSIKEMFPEGFTVLPSSVHEVIVTELSDAGDMDDMVCEVNDTEVDLEEQLSNHAYQFVA